MTTDDSLSRLRALLHGLHDVIATSLDMPPLDRSIPRRYPKSPWAVYREFEERDQSGFTLDSLPARPWDRRMP